jgi:ascorbate-specific PTS system EIIC-type component UlaA
MLFADLMPLFAQAGRQFNNNGNQADPAAAIGGMIGVMVCVGVASLVAIAVQIFFLLTLSRALQACSPRNQGMPPGQVWLSLIPLVGIVFFFMALFKVPDSLANEYRDRGLRGDGDFGKTMAIWYIVTAFVCGLISPIFLIMYWVKIAGYTKELQGRAGRSEYEDDDRPRRRSSRRGDDGDGNDDEDDRPRRRRRDEE